MDQIGLTFRKMMAILISFILFNFILPAQAETALWKVSKEGKYLYLAGTIHILQKSDYPLPKEYINVYKQSDVLVFETDIEKMHDSEVAIKLLEAMVYNNGTTIDTILKKETMDALNIYLKKRDLPIEAFLSYRPGGLYFTLMAIELQKMEMVDSGVDEYFFKKAIKDKKKIIPLETVDQQIQFITELGGGDKDDLILYGLRDLEHLPEMIAQMKSIWRKGDRKQFIDEMLAPLIKDYPNIYDSLLVKRNSVWLPLIEQMFDSPEIEMVLVGALHMVGKDGLLQQLEAKGYTVTPY